MTIIHITYLRIFLSCRNQLTALVEPRRGQELSVGADWCSGIVQRWHEQIQDLSAAVGTHRSDTTSRVRPRDHRFASSSANLRCSRSTSLDLELL